MEVLSYLQSKQSPKEQGNGGDNDRSVLHTMSVNLQARPDRAVIPLPSSAGKMGIKRASDAARHRKEATECC